MEKSFEHIAKFLPQLKIPSVYRLGLNSLLKKQFKKLKPGIVLDISLEKINMPNTKLIKLDLKGKDNFKCSYNSSYFDAVIATHLIEHLENPEKTINEIYRVLKNGGVCILSAPFIEHFHPNPKDYYRFTQDSLKLLFKDFKKVEIYHHGNKLQSIWQLLNIGIIKLVLNFFNPLIAMIKSKKTRIPCGFVVYAEK